MKGKRKLSQAGRRKIVQGNYERWNERAIKRHGDRFDYSSVPDVFETYKRPKVPIKCPTHGVFWAKPDQHLQNESGGCPNCVSELRSKLGTQLHMERYQTWLAKKLPKHLEIMGDFEGPNAPLRIRCNKHGTIKTTKAVYLKNNETYGCDLCASEAQQASQTLDLDEVHKALADNLPDHIHLTGLRRYETGTRLQMKCDRHGEFEITNGNAKQAVYFCRECFREIAGYTNHRLQRLIDTGEEGVSTEIGVMIVKVFGLSAVKVGVTTRSLVERYAWSLNQIVWSAALSERDAYVVEARTHRLCRDWHDPRIFFAGMREGKRWAGDTEVYYLERAQQITEIAKNQLRILLTEEVNFQRELDIIVTELREHDRPDLSRTKDLTNRPVAVVGVDPNTLKIVHEFDSISAAHRAGFKNVSLVIEPNNYRETSGGLRWFRKDDYDASLIKPIPKKQYGIPVRCIERDEHFFSATEPITAHHFF